VGDAETQKRTRENLEQARFPGWCGEVGVEREQRGHDEDREKDVKHRGPRLHEVEPVHEEQARRENRDGSPACQA
jgi:hypothetical protein